MILIVDDRPENILPLKKILQQHFYEVDTAESGEVALRKILKYTYSLVILDVQMPGMDGFEVAEAIAGFSKSKDTPILFLSAASKEKKFITQGYLSGGIDYLTKPVDPDILMLKVKTFQRLYQQQQDLKDIQQSLAEANERLEHKVFERTKELLDKNTELENKNHELQQFAWVVSHDLLEPLRKIKTFNKLIKDKFLPEDPQARDYFQRTIVASERMSTLIDDLLNYSRLSSVNTYEQTDLNVVVKELLIDKEETITSKNVTFNINELPTVSAVKGQIRQVFQNLFNNAIKFARPGVAPVIDVTSEFVNDLDFNAFAVPDGKYCRIVIKDNGIGFEEKFLDRIFVIFQKLHSNNEYEGTGIGLAIVKKIVERHQGIVTAKSELNEGSSFIMVLPIKQDIK